MALEDILKTVTDLLGKKDEEEPQQEVESSDRDSRGDAGQEILSSDQDPRGDPGADIESSDNDPRGDPGSR
ncbi:MAG TPA: hypothetical protein VGM51_16530 [Armatimonadota bacterium]|jgi:hypothetical protein